MPTGDGKTQVRWSVSEHTERWVKGEAQRLGCSAGEVIDALVEQSTVEKLAEVRLPFERVEDRFDRLERLLKQPPPQSANGSKGEEGYQQFSYLSNKLEAIHRDVRLGPPQPFQASVRALRSGLWPLLVIATPLVIAHGLLLSTVYDLHWWPPAYYVIAVGVSLGGLGLAYWRQRQKER